jgi:hypothetical protein
LWAVAVAVGLEALVLVSAHMAKQALVEILEPHIL